MNTTNIIIIGGLIALLALVIYYKFFRPSKVKERRIKQKAKEAKIKNLALLKERYVTNTLLFDHKNEKFLNHDGYRIPELEKCIPYRQYDKESIVPSKCLPVYISNIVVIDHDEYDYLIIYQVKESCYDFVLKYLGEANMILYSEDFGEIVLPKKLGYQYPINSELRLKFKSKATAHFYTSGDIKEYYLNVSPEIIE